MGFLTRDAILSADDLRSEVVEVPEWGGSVYVRMMTAAERDRFEAAVIAAKDASVKTDVRSMLAQFTVCDEAKRPLFTLEDMERLGQKSYAAMDRIWDAATRLNRMGPKDEADLGKASASAAPDSTPSASPSDSV